MKLTKKILALIIGAMLMYTKIISGMATNLADYPFPFIDNGKFFGALVVGDNAKAEDVIGLSDIATSLQYASTKKVGKIYSGGTVVEGDVFKIVASGDDLNILEPFSSVVVNVDKNDLKALASGYVSNNRGKFKYDQYLLFGNSTVQFVVSDEQGSVEDPALYIKAKRDEDSYTKTDGSEFLTYKISFPTALKSEVNSNRYLIDLDNKKLTMLGKEYIIIDTDFSTTGKITLKLMGGAVRDTLEEGETKTYLIDNVDYEVTAVTITDRTPYRVKFVVNGELTDALEVSETYTLYDNSQIGVREILPNEAGDVTKDIVTFYLGAQKIELQDSSLASSTSGNRGKLVIGTNTISNAYVDITGSNTSSLVSISTIEIAWQLDDNYYIPTGGKLSEHLTEKDDLSFLKAFNLDMMFEGVTGQGAKDIIEIKPSGSNKLRLKMTNKAGNEISEEILFTDGTTIYLGKDLNRQLHVNENDFITVGEYFVVEANKYSHILQLKKIDTNNQEIEIKDIATGDIDTVSYSGSTATLYKDGYAFTFSNIEANGINLTGIAVDVGDTKADLWTEHQHKIELTNTTDGYQINISEAPYVSRDDSDVTADVIKIKTTISSGKITPSIIMTTSPIYNDESTVLKNPMIQLDSNDNKLQGMTKWGTLIEQNTGGSQDSIRITIPEKETVALVYLTAGIITKKVIPEEELDPVVINKIEVGAIKFASEIKDIKSQNLISVGGPCANAVTAAVMGNPEDCTEGFQEGNGIIHLVEHDNGKVTLVVAGYSATDTRIVASVIADYMEYKKEGIYGELKGTTLFVKTPTRTISEGSWPTKAMK